jgi:hypothetical protein
MKKDQLLTFYLTPSRTGNSTQLQTVVVGRNTPITVLIGDDKIQLHLDEQRCACSQFFHPVLTHRLKETHEHAVLSPEVNVETFHVSERISARSS